MGLDLNTFWDFPTFKDDEITESMFLEEDEIIEYENDFDQNFEDSFEENNENSMEVEE